MSDLRSSNIFDALDEDAPTTSTAPKKDAKAGAEKPSSKKVDAPHKKEKQPKSEEPAAPLGKESRGGAGRDQKPRGRGRDNKGGLRRPAGSGREFDRRSGPSATHRNPREGKRGDHGRYNWGNEMEESSAAKTDEATPASPPPQADDAKAEAGTENKDAAPATTETKAEDGTADPAAKKEDDEDDKKITFDQYLKNKEASAPAGDKLTARAVEVDEEKWKGTPVVSNKKKTAKKQDDEEDDEDKKEKSKKKGGAKNTVTWFEFVGSQGPARPATREPRPPRTEGGDRSDRPARGGAAGAAAGAGAGGRGRGSGRGRGGPRGGGRGGPRAPRGAAPALDDTAFPKLGSGK